MKIKKFIAFIFARGGSKGIKNKNILKFRNTTLIGNSINQAKKCKSIQSVYVSTDSKKIAREAKKSGAIVPFIRPKYLAMDNSPEILSWLHAVNFCEKKLKLNFDYLVSVPVTSPLRKTQDLERAIKKIKKNNLDFLISVTPSNRNPYFNMVKIDKNDKISLVCKSKKKYFRRQDAPQCYDMCTVVYIVKKNYLKKNYDKILSGKVGVIKIPKLRSIDIDDKYDYNIAKFLSKA